MIKFIYDDPLQLVGKTIDGRVRRGKQFRVAQNVLEPGSVEPT